MATKHEDEFDRADRLADRLGNRLEPHEAAESAADKPVANAPDSIDADACPQKFAMARIGRRMMWLGAALVIVMATHSGVRGFFLGLKPGATPIELGGIPRPSRSEMDAIRELRVLPSDAGAGQLRFEVLAKSTSTITLDESGSHLMNSETSKTFALKDARCVAENSNHLVCSARFEAPVSTESYQLKVAVKNGNNRFARVYSEHLRLSGTDPAKKN